MEINRAAELLRALADGIDPTTGQPLPDESVYNRPEIIRALHCVLQKLQERVNTETGSEGSTAEDLANEMQLQESLNVVYNALESTINVLDTRRS